MASLKALAGRGQPGSRSRSAPGRAAVPLQYVFLPPTRDADLASASLRTSPGRARPWRPSRPRIAPPCPTRAPPHRSGHRTRPRVSYSTWAYSDSAGYHFGPRRPFAGISGRSDPDFPHFAPRLSTWQFIVGEARIQVLRALTVEECGVQWSAVVEDGGRR